MAWILPAMALLTFAASWAGVFPPLLVETWYARAVYPTLSFVAGRFADAIPVAWFDVAIPAGLALLIVLIRQRRFRWVVGIISGSYLIFFWSWALNYHRQPLASKLLLDGSRTKPDSMDRFARHAAEEINRLYREKQTYNEQRTRTEAVRRVRRVVAVIDGTEWQASGRIKTSWLLNPWFRVAGVSGEFTPFHEALVSKTLLDIEKPFVFTHELAHVRGYPNEGDANLIAFLATVMSDDPAFQYSGWLDLWFYLRSPELDALLDTGPRSDIQRILDRARAEQIRWISHVQSAILDWFLKSNSVDEGIRSYSRVALLAAGTEPYWDRFR